MPQREGKGQFLGVVLQPIEKHCESLLQCMLQKSIMASQRRAADEVDCYAANWTPPSQPNKVGLKCPSVRPQNVSSISLKFGI